MLVDPEATVVHKQALQQENPAMGAKELAYRYEAVKYDCPLFCRNAM